METSVIISGFGGQGALFAGQLLAYAGMDTGKTVTWFPSYGPEMRGGTAHCTVIISDDTIGAPIVAHPDIAIVFNRPSFEKYEPLVKTGGLLVVNSSIVEESSSRSDIKSIYVPANKIAEEMGSTKMMNVAALGAMLACRPIFSLETIEQTLTNHLPSDKADLLEGNFMVLRQGYEFAAGVKA
jgi:2-oxoglutarate ferredoxin oxidoreductase subunit gamma